MMNIVWCRIDAMRDENVSYYLKQLPSFMHSKLLRYKRLGDVKSRVAARLMILRLLEQEGCSYLINNWKQADWQKPLIEGWKLFSIAHSGNLVTVSYGHLPSGIDIEKKDDRYDPDIIKLLHEKEIEYIQNAAEQYIAFYEIWVKKESFVKAIGVCLSVDLQSFNCAGNSISFNNCRWVFKQILLSKQYTCCLCHQDTYLQLPVSVKFFDLDK